MKENKILLVEDDVSLRFAIESFLTQQTDFKIKSVGDVAAAKKALDEVQYDLVISDIKMPGGTGYEVLEYCKSKQESALVILMTAFGTIEDAVSAMKNGAYDFIVKPFQLTTLENVVQSALQDRVAILAGRTEKKTNDKPANKEESDDLLALKKVFITNNTKMKNLVENLRKVAASKATVLIQGESGTGKEVLANMIHEFSPRREKPFIAINCAALPDNLLESELFGHEKGSFTGAIQRQIGKFELSDGGTILLDEISEMSLNMQTKLLRVLQECEVYRIGGNKPIPLNLRVIASTNRDLYQYMKAGHFREDLYYRINVIPISVPPLRERGDDVLTLSEYFLKEFADMHGRPEINLDELARYKIMNHPWQGNVRELRNAMERAVLVGNFDQVINEDMTGQSDQVGQIIQNDGNASTASLDKSADLTLQEVEKRVILETLHRCKGNRTRTAEKLGISLRTLRNKLKIFREEEEALKQSGQETGSAISSSIN
ncbi:MAG: sigma-54-dependent Fis family transcriptional regulator [Deltaproteobacteria bacterium]|nr:sigma-54-dependent Fis family transcriptional regulator [Deltaproteobacteria bacterium]